MNILKKNIEEKQEIKNQPKLVKWYKGMAKWLVNDIRNSKFETHYYRKGVDNSKWEIP